jgi:integrase/recombinase XerD
MPATVEPSQTRPIYDVTERPSRHTDQTGAQEDLVGHWLVERNYSALTALVYRDTVERFFSWCSVQPDHVTTDDVTRFLTRRPESGISRYAPNTLRRERSALRSFFRWATASGHTGADPTLHLDQLVLGHGSVRQGRWLTLREARALLGACRDGSLRGLRDEALLSTGLLTGLRASELVAVRWRDVNLSRQRLVVVGKGSKPAELGLPGQARDTLHRWRTTVTDVLSGPPRPHWPVFPAGHKRGGIGVDLRYEFNWQAPYTTRGLRHVLEFRADRAGLGRIAPHDLRRSFAGFLDEDEVDLRGIQAALRHESPATTMRHYLTRDPRRAVLAVRHLTI